MKKLLLSISAFALSCLQLNAQVPNMVFSDIYAGTSTGNSDFATSVLDFPNGEVIMAGSTGNLNPFPFNVKNPYLNTNFIGKFNEVGANVWQSTIGVATVAQLAKDANNNIFAVGYAQGTSTSFDGVGYGNTGNNNLGSQNVFVAKYSPSGAILWVKVVGALGNEYGTGIAVDNSGDVYVSGYCNSGAGVFDFEPGVAAATFTCSMKPFLVKLTNNGNYLWHKIMPNGGYNYHAVCADANNVYWATQIAGSGININSGGPIYYAYSQSNSYDILLMKYRKDGTLVNAKTIGGSTNTDYARGIEVKNGNIVMFGAITQGTAGAINMNGYAEIPNISLTANGTTNKDGFIALYDTMMVCQWARPIGGTTANDEIWGGAFDNTGNVLVSGLFTGTNTNFNIGGAGTYTASSNGTTVSDYFYSSYNTLTGNCNWVYKQGGTAADQAADIAVDVDGRIWAAGYINNGSTGNDMFLNKHFCASTYTVSIDRNGYNSPIFNGNFGFIGCDSQQAVYTATAVTNTNVKYSFYDLNGLQSNSNVFTEPAVAAGMATKGYKLLVKDSVTKCEQVFNIQYSQVNSLNPAFAVNGPFGLSSQCPSSSILLQGNYNTGVSYTWTPGPIVTPSPTNTTIYVSPSVTTTYTATIYDGIPSNAGCYWSASATVTVAPSNTITGVVSSTLLCSGDQLGFSVNGTANSYTWTSGNNGTLSNSPTFSFSPTTTDTYTLFTTTGSCSNTYTVNVTVNTCTSIQNINNASGISIYPNPTNGLLFIDLTHAVNTSTVELSEVTGRVILNETMTSTQGQINVSNLNNGVYFLKINNGTQQNISKIVKQ